MHISPPTIQHPNPACFSLPLSPLCPHSLLHALHSSNLFHPLLFSSHSLLSLSCCPVACLVPRPLDHAQNGKSDKHTQENDIDRWFSDQAVSQPLQLMYFFRKIGQDLKNYRQKESISYQSKCHQCLCYVRSHCKSSA